MARPGDKVDRKLGASAQYAAIMAGLAAALTVVCLVIGDWWIALVGVAATGAFVGGYKQTSRRRKNYLATGEYDDGS